MRVGITGGFLLSMYIIMSTIASWKAAVTPLPEKVTDQEVLSRKLDRIEIKLNKLGE